MAAPLRKICSIHPNREAVVRCPSCGRDFCRECASEHDGVLLCAACLKSRTHVQKEHHRSWSKLRRAGEACLGLALLWIVFYSVGTVIVATPTANHEYLLRDFANRVQDAIPEAE